MNTKPKGKRYMRQLAHTAAENRQRNKEMCEKTREIIRKDFEPVVFKEAVINIFES